MARAGKLLCKNSADFVGILFRACLLMYLHAVSKKKNIYIYIYLNVTINCEYLI